jgi:hypothetical protein
MSTNKRLGQKVIFLLLCALMLSSSLQNIPITSAQSNVSFTIDSGWISGTLDSYIMIPSNSISAGEQQNITMSLSTNNITVNLAIPNIGNASVQVNALGSHEYSIPDLHYNYSDRAQFGLYLAFEGIITGNLLVDQNATLSASSLTWNASGSNTVTLTVPQQAVEGTTFNVTLANITYHITATVKARGEVLGVQKEVTVLNSLQISSAEGSSQSVSGLFTLKPSIDFLGVALWVVSGALIAIIIVTGFFLLQAKKKLTNIAKPTPLNSTNNFCGSCGTANSTAAQFCKKCGKKLNKTI